jgi:predicted nucleotidyltransferase
MSKDENAVDIEQVRVFLEKKEAERRKHLHTQWEEARRDFQRIVNHIIETYHPKKIYQWGSLLDASQFIEISDIDIALEGLLGPEEYFAVLGDAIEMTKFPIDIIELEKIDPADAERIRRKGKLIYEQ